MFKVKYVDYIMMLVRLDLNLIVSLFQHKCEVSETISTTTLQCTDAQLCIPPQHERDHGNPASMNHTFYDVITSSGPETDRQVASLRNRCLDPGKYVQHLQRWLQYYPARQVRRERRKRKPDHGRKHIIFYINGHAQTHL